MEKELLECPLCHKLVAELFVNFVYPSCTSVRCNDCNLELTIDYNGHETHEALVGRWKSIGSGVTKTEKQ